MWIQVSRGSSSGEAAGVRSESKGWWWWCVVISNVEAGEELRTEVAVEAAEGDLWRSTEVNEAAAAATGRLAAVPLLVSTVKVCG